MITEVNSNAFKYFAHFSSSEYFVLILYTILKHYPNIIFQLNRKQGLTICVGGIDRIKKRKQNTTLFIFLLINIT